MSARESRCHKSWLLARVSNLYESPLARTMPSPGISRSERNANEILQGCKTECDKCEWLAHVGVPFLSLFAAIPGIYGLSCLATPEQLQREWGVESKCIQAYLMWEIERGGFSASCLRPMVPSLPCPHKAEPIPLCWDNPSPKQWQTGTNLRLWAVLEQEKESKERGAGRKTLPPPRNK